MNAYNPLDSMKRPEAAGWERRQAEAFASEIGDSKNDLVTDETMEMKLDAALNRQLVRFGVLMSGLMALAATVIGLLNSIK